MSPYKPIALGLVAITNLLFLYKYLARASVAMACASLLVWFMALGLVVYLYYKPQIHKWVPVALLLGMSALSIACISLVDKETLRVDRWEIVALFFDSIEQGINPYSQHLPSGNPIGAMPIYFLILAPFHYIGELSLALLTTLAGIFIYAFRKLPNQQTYVLAALAAISIPLYWELACRSTILVNSLVFLFYFLWLYQTIEQHPQALALPMFIGGLLLSTRTVFALPLLLFFGILLSKVENVSERSIVENVGRGRLVRDKIVENVSERSKMVSLLKIVGYGVLVLVGYVLPLVPFFATWPEQMLAENPFITQGTNLIPFWVIAILAVVALGIGIGLRSYDRQLGVFYGGILLFAAGLAHLICCAATTSFTEAYINSGADISYLLFSYPFFGYVLLKED